MRANHTRRGGASVAALALASCLALPPSAAKGFALPPSFPALGQKAGLGSPLAATRDRAFVLCWHTFLGTPSVDTDFSLEEFARQLDALLSLGYRFIGLEDLLFGRFSGALNLVATIDDGHRTISEAYAKVLSARGIVAGLFVFPSVIGTSPYYLSVEQLNALGAAGSPIEAHGYYHLYVNEALYKREKAVFEKEIFAAKDKVEAITGLPAYAFAYPFGAFSPITKSEVARAGYSFALAVKPGFVYADARLNDPYELPRTVVTRSGWKDMLAFLERNAHPAGATRIATTARPPSASLY